MDNVENLSFVPKVPVRRYLLEESDLIGLIAHALYLQWYYDNGPYDNKEQPGNFERHRVDFCDRVREMINAGLPFPLVEDGW